MRYNLFVDDTGYGWEVEDGVFYPLMSYHFPRVLKRGGRCTWIEKCKKIPKEYT